MTGEFSFFGLYFPVLMLTSLIALVATRLISLFLARKGFYRHIWHPPLFDVALFFVVLGLLVTLYKFGRF